MSNLAILLLAIGVIGLWGMGAAYLWDGLKKKKIKCGIDCYKCLIINKGLNGRDDQIGRLYRSDLYYFFL
ncbi:MAG: hypothetical protein FVQ77_11420 [Cytophagales bacterium]|nr:hypothetical protein [Cytophagales bacterium]